MDRWKAQGGQQEELVDSRNRGKNATPGAALAMSKGVSE